MSQNTTQPKRPNSKPPTTMFNRKCRRYLLKLLSKEIEITKTPKYTFTNKMLVIEYVLKSGCSWISLDKKKLKIVKAHESTYRKFFYKLCKLDFFRKVTEKFLNKRPENLYIDTTTFINKAALTKDVGFCSKDKKHRGLKYSTFCDDSRNIYIGKVAPANVHDIKLLEPTLKDIKPTNLVADKGYVSDELKKDLKDKNINLVFPYRNYTKSTKLSSDGSKKFKKKYKENTAEDKKLLKNRYKIENSFSRLKQFKLYIRTEG